MRFPWAGIILLELWLMVGAATAQDLSISRLDLVLEGGLQTVTPSSIDRLTRPKLPAELAKHDGYAYAVIRGQVRSDGTLGSSRMTGTHPLLGPELLEPSTDGMTVTRREGPLVAGECWLAMIFNPASAPIIGSNVRPRLQHAAPVLIEPAGMAAWPQNIAVRLKLDETGKVTGFERLEKTAGVTDEALNRALEHWRFAPARAGKRPVAASVDVKVHVITDAPPGVVLIKPPRILREPDLEYPLDMMLGIFEGWVLVEFGVDSSGRVQRPFVAESTNAGFDAAAVECVRHTEFEPASCQGLPVEYRRMQRTFVFYFKHGGRTLLNFGRSGQGYKSLPPELQWDVPPYLRNFTPAVYPLPALLEKRRGKVNLTFVIGANGRAAHVKIIEAEHADFAEAAKAMMATLVCEPARRDKKPVPVLVRMTLLFDERRGDVTLTAPARKVLRILQGGDAKFATMAALDAKPVPISRKAPVFPAGLAVDQGRAVVEFYVDEAGIVQLPHIIEATAPEFGYAACQSVATWRFEPPLIKGEPAVVRLQVPVSFKRL